MIELKNTPFEIPAFDLTGKVAIITNIKEGLNSKKGPYAITKIQRIDAL